VAPGNTRQSTDQKIVDALFRPIRVDPDQLNPCGQPSAVGQRLTQGRAMFRLKHCNNTDIFSIDFLPEFQPDGKRSVENLVAAKVAQRSVQHLGLGATTQPLLACKRSCTASPG
jgi:hypothetical protein